VGAVYTLTVIGCLITRGLETTAAWLFIGPCGVVGVVLALEGHWPERWRKRR
jgi:hypothetical protein